jgi:hypothetical protein
MGMGENYDITLLTPRLFAVCTSEGLEFTRLELNILHNICKGVKKLEEEPIAKAAKQLWKLSTHSLHSGEWSDRDGLLYFCGFHWTLISNNVSSPSAMTHG